MAKQNTKNGIKRTHEYAKRYQKKSSEPVDGQPGRPNKGPLADGGLQVKTGKFRSARTYTKTIKSDCNINRYNKCHRKGKMRTS